MITNLKNACLSENVFFDGESDDELIVEVTPVVLYSSSLFEISEDECDALLAGEEDDLELIADISFGADELNFETSDKNF